MIEKHPLICPKCGGRNITYVQGAGVSQYQAVDGPLVSVKEGWTTYTDDLLEVVCRDCKFKDDDPSFPAWRGL